MSTTAPPARRWLFVVAGFVAVLVPGLVVVGVVLLQRLAPRDRGEEPVALEGAADAGLARAGKARKDGASAGEEPDPFVEALGSLTGAHLYQSYLNLGLLADAVESEVYTPEQARDMLATVGGTMEAVEKHLDRLPRSRLDEAEREQLDRARELIGLLRTQTRELKAYWDTDKQEHADRFQKAREQALEGIKALLEGE
jgi:hypothetical protein